MDTKLDEKVDKIILSFQIDNEWKAIEFSDFFNSVNILYDYYTLYHSTFNQVNKLGNQFKWKEKMKLPMFFDLKDRFIKTSYNIFLNQINQPYDKVSFTINYRWNYFPLQVKKIKFGSKGNIDLLGIGQVLETIKDLIIHYLPNKEKKLDAALKLKEVEEKEQKILEIKIENLKKLGFSTQEITSIIGLESFHINNIIQLGNQGKIIGIDDYKLTRY